MKRSGYAISIDIRFALCEHIGGNVKIINKWELNKFRSEHASAIPACDNWQNITQTSQWSKFSDVRNSFNSVDCHKGLYIFNLGKHYRLIGTIDFFKKQLLIKEIMHHDKYERGEWKR